MLRQIPASLAVIFFLFATSAFAIEGVLYDSRGFEAPTFTSGVKLAGQDANNPWLSFGGTPQSFVVQSDTVSTGTQAVQANGGTFGGVSNGGFAWPNLGFVPAPGEKVRVQVDIARTLTPTIANSSPVYAVEVADFDINRTTRFGLIWRDDSEGIRAFVNVPSETDPFTRPEFYGSAINENQWANFEVVLDYTAKTLSLAVDGTALDDDIVFNTAESATLDSVAFQVGTLTSSTDKGWFDNFSVTVIDLAGDYNQNGAIDAADYVVWRNTENASVTPGSGADGNRNGTIDAEDLEIWRARFALPILAELGSGSTVPEPVCGALALVSTAILVAMRRR